MKGWLLHHRQAAALAARRLAATPLNTLLGALVLGIALALPAGGEMLLANFQRLAQRIAATPQISVFMALDAAKGDVADVESRLRRHAQTREVRLVRRDDTLKRFKESEGLAEVIENLPRNPFPMPSSSCRAMKRRPRWRRCAMNSRNIRASSMSSSIRPG